MLKDMQNVSKLSSFSYFFKSSLCDIYVYIKLCSRIVHQSVRSEVTIYKYHSTQFDMLIANVF